MDEEVQELIRDYDLDEETAELIREIMDEYGVDEATAIELMEGGV